MAHDDFDIIRTEIPFLHYEFSDFLEVEYKMSDEFSDAVQRGRVPIILQDDPYDTEIDQNTPSAKNTMALVASVFGYNGHYNWESNTLTVYMNDANIAMAFREAPSERLKQATKKLLRPTR